MSLCVCVCVCVPYSLWRHIIISARVVCVEGRRHGGRARVVPRAARAARAGAAPALAPLPPLPPGALLGLVGATNTTHVSIPHLGADSKSFNKILEVLYPFSPRYDLLPLRPRNHNECKIMYKAV